MFEFEKGRLPLGDALKRYWPYLIGITVFPTIATFGLDVFGLPFGPFLILFFCVFAFAAWPFFRFDAPYSFWLCACGFFFLGGLVAALLVQLYRVIAG